MRGAAPLRVNGKKHACSAALVAQCEVAALRAGMRRGNLSAGAQKLNQPFSPSRVGAQKLSRPLGAGLRFLNFVKCVSRNFEIIFERARCTKIKPRASPAVSPLVCRD